MVDKITQNESKFVVEWLRKEHHVSISNKLEFWKLTPTAVADRVKRELNIQQITDQDILRAARRID